MKKRQVLAAYLGAMLLGGCSNKPDVGDVEAGLKEIWKPCNLVKPTSFKKTNGADRGDHYQMAISYKLEVDRDIAAEDIWIIKSDTREFYYKNCPDPVKIYFKAIAEENNKRGKGLKKGETFDVSTEYAMIKSENGWVIK